MHLNTIKYSGVMLALLAGLSTNATHAASSSIDNSSVLSSSLNFLSTGWSPLDLKQGHTVIQLGGYWSSQGKDQHINVQYVAGNQYTVNHQNPGNGLFGLGYFVDGLHKDHFQLVYGLNAFYLPGTHVNGDIVEEDSFTNLSYSYNIRHVPLYLAAKALINTTQDKLNVTLDVGIGPNFMQTNHYKELPEVDYITPNDSFSSHNSVAFTAMAGIGLRLNNVFGHSPLECGYRFFYLGQGQLAINNDQIINTLKTGNNYANAVLCSITV